MPSENIISLQSHTLGSIGQIVKNVSLLREKYSDSEAMREIERIYKGYVAAIKVVTFQT